MTFVDKHQPIFPPANCADEEGALCYTHGLSVAALRAGYTAGAFPWVTEDGYVIWFSPPERCVIFPDRLHVSRSLQKLLKRERLHTSFNQDFNGVIRGCAGAPGRGRSNTWITDEFIETYTALHTQGGAISVEVRKGDVLVGGLYGVVLGSVLAAESMFSLQPGASKVAMVALCRQGGFRIIDCQVPSPHLLSMGAHTLPRREYLTLITGLTQSKSV